MLVIMNVFLTILLLVTTKCIASQKLNIMILYESLCPDSVKFVNDQLYPNWAALTPYVDIHYVPFGKSKSHSGDGAFTCQHGPMECAGNKIQSCALHALRDQNAQTEFVHCFMNTFNKQDAGQTCAAQVGLNWGYIEQCYENQNGVLLQLQAEHLTRQFAPKFVPTIIYNGVFNQQDQDESLENFVGVICRYLNKVYPELCK